VWRYLFCCFSWPYEDETFIGAAALGDHSKNDPRKPTAARMEADTVWIRAHELKAFKGKRPQLFEGEIEPSDLCQGAVGDCWLVLVTVDDRIPCKKKTKKPRFMSPNGNELWAIILEKAYAKWCGSYAALDGGVSIIESIVFHLGIYELNSLRFHILRYLSSFSPLFSSSCGAGIA
jgi:hypothetical protein